MTQIARQPEKHNNNIISIIHQSLQGKMHIPVQYSVAELAASDELYSYLGISETEYQKLTTLSKEQRHEALFKVQPMPKNRLEHEAYLAKRKILSQMIQQQNDQMQNETGEKTHEQTLRRLLNLLDNVQNGIVRYQFNQEDINQSHRSKMVLIFSVIDEDVHLDQHDTDMLMGINLTDERIASYLPKEALAQQNQLAEELETYAKTLLELIGHMQSQRVVDFIQGHFYRLSIVMARYNISLADSSAVDLLMREMIYFVMQHLNNEKHRKDIERLVEDSDELNSSVEG